MEKKLRVALLQFSPLSYELERNLSKALEFAKEAVDKGAKLIILPELFDSGYCVEDKDKEFAIDFKDNKNPTLLALQSFAREHGVYIVANSIEKAKNTLFDTAFIIGKKGFVGKYRKIYLWGDESKRFERGKKYPVFELKFDDFKLKFGLQICYEIGFSEGARFLALQGAEVICYTAAFGRARLYAWDLASRARALENGTFVLACNRSGSEVSKLSGETLEFAANSRIISPKGEILTEAHSDECIVYCELNLDEVEIQRKNLPYLKDLNPKLNQKILKKLNLNTKETKWQKKF